MHKDLLLIEFLFYRKNYRKVIELLDACVAPRKCIWFKKPLVITCRDEIMSVVVRYNITRVSMMARALATLIVSRKGVRKVAGQVAWTVSQKKTHVVLMFR